MQAYYYGFGETGNEAIDKILSAVACAGKAAHGTADWSDEQAPWEDHTGNCPVDWIQNAAEEAAAYISDRESKLAANAQREEEWRELVGLERIGYAERGDSEDKRVEALRSRLLGEGA